MKDKKKIKHIKTILQYNRIRILRIVVKKETCACELVEKLDMPNNLVSHHLKTLADINVLRSRKVGLHNKYSINPKKKKQIQKILTCIETF